MNLYSKSTLYLPIPRFRLITNINLNIIIIFLNILINLSLVILIEKTSLNFCFVYISIGNIIEKWCRCTLQTHCCTSSRYGCRDCSNIQRKDRITAFFKPGKNCFVTAKCKVCQTASKNSLQSLNFPEYLASEVFHSSRHSPSRFSA